MWSIEELGETLIEGDAFEVLPTVPAESVDLVLTDPPYNIATDAKLTMQGGEVVTTARAWGDAFNDSMSPEEYTEFMRRLAEDCHRVLKPTGSLIVFYDRSNPQSLARFYELFKFRNLIAFVKKTPLPHFRKTNYRSGFELAAWFTKGADYTLNFIDQTHMINVFYGDAGSKETPHPTEKYRWMIRPLIERHTRPGDLVLDPMMGSGTVPLCAKTMGRRYLGIEANPEWSLVARRRVHSAPACLSDYIHTPAAEVIS